MKRCGGGEKGDAAREDCAFGIHGWCWVPGCSRKVNDGDCHHKGARSFDELVSCDDCSGSRTRNQPPRGPGTATTVHCTSKTPSPPQPFPSIAHRDQIPPAQSLRTHTATRIIQEPGLWRGICDLQAEKAFFGATQWRVITDCNCLRRSVVGPAYFRGERIRRNVAAGTVE